MQVLHRRGTGRTAALGAVALVLVGCSSLSGPQAAGTGVASTTPSEAPSQSTAPASESPSESATPEVRTPHLNITRGEVAFDRPVRIGVSNATVVSARVVQSHGGATLPGRASDAQHWTSNHVPVPGASYRVAATVKDSEGSQRVLHAGFAVAKVPDESRLTLDVSPGGGTTVGVGAPITVRFDQEVTNKKAVEEALEVQSSPRTTGAWRWLGSQQVQFRPRNPWRPGTRVRAVLDLNGVHAAKDVWGGRTYDLHFRVGHERTTVVDASRHTFTLWQGGRITARWATSTGKPGYQTRTGNYIVLGGVPLAHMTSCGAGLSCTPGVGDYYDLQVQWATRLTNTGTFIHAAPWSIGAQGVANVSHGCIHLTPDRAKVYFDTAKYGDIVKVRGTGRGSSDLVNSGDPGMVNWNMSFGQWKAGSALHRVVVTRPLSSASA